jgi:hypothetical protein
MPQGVAVRTATLAPAFGSAREPGGTSCGLGVKLLVPAKSLVKL